MAESGRLWASFNFFFLFKKFTLFLGLNEKSQSLNFLSRNEWLPTHKEPLHSDRSLTEIYFSGAE